MFARRGGGDGAVFNALAAAAAASVARTTSPRPHASTSSGVSGGREKGRSREERSLEREFGDGREERKRPGEDCLPHRRRYREGREVYDEDREDFAHSERSLRHRRGGRERDADYACASETDDPERRGDREDSRRARHRAHEGEGSRYCYYDDGEPDRDRESFKDDKARKGRRHRDSYFESRNCETERDRGSERRREESGSGHADEEPLYRRRHDREKTRRDEDDSRTWSAAAEAAERTREAAEDGGEEAGSGTSEEAGLEEETLGDEGLADPGAEPEGGGDSDRRADEKLENSTGAPHARGRNWRGGARGGLNEGGHPGYPPAEAAKRRREPRSRQPKRSQQRIGKEGNVGRNEKI
ncbi:hypothetical protein NCLIV_007050 [Neospora caninum Liverpool]|uniref:Uncharacterized protein n=1 Tax=Neospora caninum (strain Liverpool) TaxID=572307 RepID=F0V9R9_NEOCL|nr:hypothetical protein NCLIV_007050 [Neospora caninum Liverpool]CBZ50230.1 hypothetical protein NCLIV_007050 [Neospora caninum Liverpool]|eukprot:XP_003880265.1 hypothetical protein NCLIV_007050 [Neospora caninum Liverpool]